MADKYVPQEIEPKWQAQWDADHLYRSEVDWNRPKHYAMTMLPYPSGDLHIGHWFAMTPSDARARYMRMKGYNVLFPIGFDAFGLPAEQAAISRNIHPKEWTYANIERMRRQLHSMGAMFDMRREAVSCDPIYYRWTEWYFRLFFENDLAYRSGALVNWSPTLQTVLANEQVIDGKDERTGQPVVQKMMEQWFFRITHYADELLNFDHIDWPEHIRVMQTNWIGRSEGARVTFTTEHGDAIEVFTTRPDTLWGATFMVLAPEHALVATLTTPQQRAAVDAYVAQAARATEIERTAEGREKTGVFTGSYAVNPVNRARIPIWIADYVMSTYGSGAIMAVPAHDQRDFDFARKFGLEIIPVIQPEGDLLDGATMAEAYVGPGVMINSGPFNGTFVTEGKGRKNPGISAVIDWLQERGIGQESINYRLRDWLISRQRYWGAPIPMIYKEDGTIESVPESDLPVLLPDDVEFVPTGQSPLLFHERFRYTTAPDGTPARRETDTMDTFMCSSWYQYRYLSPQYDRAPFDPEEAAYWLPVDVYTGGAEHATLHLMYTRFFTKAMRDLGVFDDALALAEAHGRTADEFVNEPMTVLRNQGQILGEERRGDMVAAKGYSDDQGKLFARRIEVIDLSASQVNEPDQVIGEIMGRTENVLRIDGGGSDWRTVEVLPDAEIIIPRIGGKNNVNQLRHHLEIQRMSKSKGNVVNPDELVKEYGADTVRGYLMFAFDWQKGGPWNSQGILGVVRWLNDVWTLVNDGMTATEPDLKTERDIRRKLHQAIKKVSDGLELFSFNTAVAGLMELKNALQSATRAGNVSQAARDEAISTMLVLMAPFTPHIAEELWARVGGEYSVHLQPWPTYDPEIAAEDEITLVVQVNGKVRDRIQVPAGIGDEEAMRLALESEGAQRHMDGKPPRKVIYVAARGMVSIVV